MVNNKVIVFNTLIMSNDWIINYEKLEYHSGIILPNPMSANILILGLPT